MNRPEWLDSVMVAHGAGVTFGVAYALADKSDHDLKPAWPSVAHLCDKTGQGEATVRRALRKLRSTSHLKTTRGYKASNIYHFSRGTGQERPVSGDRSGETGQERPVSGDRSVRSRVTDRTSSGNLTKEPPSSPPSAPTLPGFATDRPAGPPPPNPIPRRPPSPRAPKPPAGHPDHGACMAGWFEAFKAATGEEYPRATMGADGKALKDLLATPGLTAAVVVPRMAPWLRATDPKFGGLTLARFCRTYSATAQPARDAQAAGWEATKGRNTL